MKILGIIPSRYSSTRLPGKPLIQIAGKPLIQHVWERAKQSKLLSDIIIATDDKRILNTVFNFGGKAVLTSQRCHNGTERCAEVIKNMNVDIVINIQGDEPLMSPKTIDSLVREISSDKESVMATAAVKIVDNTEIDDPNVVKVVFDNSKKALYFSRSLIPYPRDKSVRPEVYKHLGIYAYKKKFLLDFIKFKKCKIEQTEQLEQLRAIEYGYKIKVVVVNNDSIGVDTPEDIVKVARIIEKWS